MRVHFINRFYWPAEPATAQLLADLAEGLAARAWPVTVIAGHSSRDLAAAELRRGVTIHRVGPLMARTQNLARRALDFVAFQSAVRRHLLRTVAAGDVVVALTDPPLIGVAAAKSASARGAQLVHWVHDIYPEVLTAVTSNPAARLASAFLRPRRNAAWQRAAACVVLGETMAKVVRANGVSPDRIQIVPNWAPQGVEPAPASAVAALRQTWSLEGKFVVAYSGNLGRVHDVMGLVEVAARLREDPRFVFLCIGGGAGFARLQRAAQSRGLSNVRFLPPQPRASLAVSLSLPDVHLVSLREGCEAFVFPSKVYGVAAVGRPVLVWAAPDSELAAIVAEAGLGATFRPADASGIVGWLRGLAEDPARGEQLARAATRFAHASGGAAAAVQAWDGLLRKLDRTR